MKHANECQYGETRELLGNICKHLEMLFPVDAMDKNESCWETWKHLEMLFPVDAMNKITYNVRRMMSLAIEFKLSPKI